MLVDSRPAVIEISSELMELSLADTMPKTLVINVPAKKDYTLFSQGLSKIS